MKLKIWISGGLIAIVVIVTIIFVINNDNRNQTLEVIEQIENAQTNIDSDIAQSVYDFIFQLRLEHPEIIMAQCIEESGNFTSDLFKNANNCLGMKVPGQRITLAVATYKGHAKFKSWHDCILDYAIWQSCYARGLGKDDYYAFLDKLYAEADGYSNRLKKIIKQYDL